MSSNGNQMSEKTALAPEKNTVQVENNNETSEVRDFLITRN